VIPETAYPAVFMTTGEFDGRVEAYHSRKMTAALQASSSSGLPVLLRTNQSGHGMGSSRNERIDEDADMLAFFYDQLGVKFSESLPR
jgi:prolyl oligopeptidase